MPTITTKDGVEISYKDWDFANEELAGEALLPIRKQVVIAGRGFARRSVHCGPI
jgi:hypothetical protein